MKLPLCANDKIFISGARAIFIFEKEVAEKNMGSTLSGNVHIGIKIGSKIDIQGNAQFESVDNETSSKSALRVSFHGDFLIGMSEGMIV